MEKNRVLSLEEVQGIELEILEYIHEICEKHGIKYFLDFGTLLGAVRHKGFIPWDDDTDISLARDEYERLHDILAKEDHPRFKLISYQTNHHYPFPYYRLYDARTYREHNLRYKDVQLGTCVDFFAYDGFPQDERVIKKILLYNYQRKCSVYNFAGIKTKGSFLKNLPRYLGVLLYKCSRVQRWNRKINHYTAGFDLKTYKRCGCIQGMVFNKEPKLRTEWLYDTIDMEFAGKVFKVPRHYDKFLEYTYGKDYMTPPPKEQQVPGTEKNFIRE
ncbi:MAG: LicD family protein [Eubacteriales bacterium]|nr:LicD family protein [Eubacteriales bacterium]